jgi:hypothetical protein
VYPAPTRIAHEASVAARVTTAHACAQTSSIVPELVPAQGPSRCRAKSGPTMGTVSPLLLPTDSSPPTPSTALQWNPRDSTASIPIFLASAADGTDTDDDDQKPSHVGCTEEGHGLGFQVLPYDVGNSERGTCSQLMKPPPCFRSLGAFLPLVVQSYSYMTLSFRLPRHRASAATLGRGRAQAVALRLVRT